MNQTTKSAAPAVKDMVEVRLLQDCCYGKGNDIVSIPRRELHAAKQAAYADEHEASLAYARSLPQNSHLPGA